jgi:hypothetical protein
MIDIMQLPGISDPEAPSRLQAYSPQQLDLSGPVLQNPLFLALLPAVRRPSTKMSLCLG